LTQLAQSGIKAEPQLDHLQDTPQAVHGMARSSSPWPRFTPRQLPARDPSTFVRASLQNGRRPTPWRR
jgi:hypothetical protein